MIFLKPQALYLSILAIPQLCLAGSIKLDFSLDTAQLVSSPGGPFSIDFQFLDGGGTADANNMLNISNFTFGGGSAIGSAALTGGITGGLISGVSIVDSSFLNEFTQGFMPGSSLKFQVTSTANVDASGVPDEFSFAILDGIGVEIPTEGLASIGSDVFLDLNIDFSISPSVRWFASDPTRSPAAGGDPITTGPPTVTETMTGTPELPTIFLASFAFCIIAAWKGRFLLLA